jgi:O-antigen ligase
VERRQAGRRQGDRLEAAARAADLEKVQAALVAGMAATCAVSIFAAQALLAVAVAVYLVRLLRGEVRLSRLPLDGPILAFAVWTLLSASFSLDPLASHESAKKLVLFAVFYVAVDVMRRPEERERVLDAAVLGGVALAAGALLQYQFLGFDTLQHRPRSFLGHYMTASGLVMAVLVLAAARLVFRRRPAAPTRADLAAAGVLAAALAALTLLKASGALALEGERVFVAGLVAAGAALVLGRGRWPTPATSSLLCLTAVPLCAAALLVSRTRNAWLGAVAGLAAVAVLRAPRLLWALAGAVVALGLLRPSLVAERLTVMDASSKDRWFMWQAGIDMIRDKPVFGQGPRMVEVVYPRYRWPEAPNPLTPHLHNNALQIAAESGLPALAWWLWLVSAIMGDALRELRRRAARAARGAAGAAFALLCATMVAGLFEYNFGDSEILMLLLVVSAAPYALRRQREDAEAAA